VTIATTDRTSPLTVDEAMQVALGEARLARDAGEVPVGAVAMVGGRVVAARHNEREGASDPTAHAEILALRDAATALGGWRLTDVVLVVTLEPCPMCAGALVAARVGRVVFGASDPRAGACGTLYNLCCDPRLNHELEVQGGIAATECGALLSSFFAEKRADGDDDETAGAAGEGV
jgi:tRNA(adenine34) deaminase